MSNYMYLSSENLELIQQLLTAGKHFFFQLSVHWQWKKEKRLNTCMCRSHVVTNRHRYSRCGKLARDIRVHAHAHAQDEVRYMCVDHQ